MTQQAKWTLMIYMAGDNNLATAGETDLDEMRRVGSTSDVNVVAQFDNARARGTTRYLVKKNAEQEHVEHLGVTDSGSPEVLLDFVRWATTTYPAERYGLVLWNHGSGWDPLEIDRIAREAHAPNYDPREASVRSASPLGKVFFRTTLEKILELPSPQERAICTDDGSGHSLDTVELGRVLAQVRDLLGKPLDLLGMDACLMSCLEVAYQARAYAHCMVGSEEIEPNSGWPYDVVLRELVTRPDIATAELAAAIAEGYVQSYTDAGSHGPVTQTALDLGRVEDLVEPLDRLADAVMARLPEHVGQLWQAHRKVASFYDLTLWDIGQLCEELPKKLADEAVAQAAADVRAALEPGPDRFVLAVGNLGTKVERCGGVTVYLPLTTVSRYYDELMFAQEHRWAALLKRYHEA